MRIHLASVDAVHSHPVRLAVNTKMPVDHPLNCRCRKCRYDED